MGCQTGIGGVFKIDCRIAGGRSTQLRAHKTTHALDVLVIIAFAECTKRSSIGREPEQRPVLALSYSNSFEHVVQPRHPWEIVATDGLENTEVCFVSLASCNMMMENVSFLCVILTAFERSAVQRQLHA